MKNVQPGSEDASAVQSMNESGLEQQDVAVVSLRTGVRMERQRHAAQTSQFSWAARTTAGHFSH